MKNKYKLNISVRLNIFGITIVLGSFLEAGPIIDTTDESISKPEPLSKPVTGATDINKQKCSKTIASQAISQSVKRTSVIDSSCIQNYSPDIKSKISNDKPNVSKSNVKLPTCNTAIRSLKDRISKDPLIPHQPLMPTFFEPMTFVPIKTNVTRFLKNYDFSATRNCWSDNLKIKFLVNYLEGVARAWFMEYLTKQENAIKAWADVKSDFKSRFADPIDSAYRKFMIRKQAVDERPLGYYYDKLELCDDVDPEMKLELITLHVKTGLRPELLNGFYLLSGKIKTREDLEDVIKVLDGLYQHQQRNEKQRRVSSINDVNLQNKKDKQRVNFPNTRNNGRKVRCFCCDKLGHFARMCNDKSNDKENHKRNRRGSNNINIYKTVTNNGTNPIIK